MQVRQKRLYELVFSAVERASHTPTEVSAASASKEERRRRKLARRAERRRQQEEKDEEMSAGGHEGEAGEEEDEEEGGVALSQEADEVSLVLRPKPGLEELHAGEKGKDSSELSLPLRPSYP